MAGNPMVDQGILNRVKASIHWVSNSALDVAPAFLGKEGIRLALEGVAADYFPTMTGAVPSPIPYQIATLTINLLKSQNLGYLYQMQFAQTTIMGNATVYPDVSLNSQGIGVYQLYNCVLESVREMTFAGEDPLFVVTAKGYILVNAAMFN